MEETLSEENKAEYNKFQKFFNAKKVGKNLRILVILIEMINEFDLIFKDFRDDHVNS